MEICRNSIVEIMKKLKKKGRNILKFTVPFPCLFYEKESGMKKYTYRLRKN